MVDTRAAAFGADPYRAAAGFRRAAIHRRRLQLRAAADILALANSRPGELPDDHRRDLLPVLRLVAVAGADHCRHPGADLLPAGLWVGEGLWPLGQCGDP